MKRMTEGGIRVFPDCHSRGVDGSSLRSAAPRREEDVPSCRHHLVGFYMAAY